MGLWVQWSEFQLTKWQDPLLIRHPRGEWLVESRQDGLKFAPYCQPCMLCDSRFACVLMHIFGIFSIRPTLSGMCFTASHLSGMSRCSQPTQADDDCMHMAHCCAPPSSSILFPLAGHVIPRLEGEKLQVMKTFLEAQQRQMQAQQQSSKLWCYPSVQIVH